MKKLFFIAITLLLIAGLSFTGCSKSNSKNITFTVALSEDIRAVDPGVAWNYVTNQVTN